MYKRQDYLKQMQQLFRLDVHLVTEQELPDYADVRVMPWGWNPAIRKRMLKGGIVVLTLTMFRRFWSAYVAVSYTHLDVDKRQESRETR